ncbi:MAG: hypothetical protein Q9165_000118 [Trypethelium subeluteriae]
MASEDKANLLSLPWEIREEIIYLALIPPQRPIEGDSEQPLIRSSCLKRSKMYDIWMVNSAYVQRRRRGDVSPGGCGTPVDADCYGVSVASTSTESVTYWGSEQMSSILRVCRQLHDEGRDILYGNFVFSVETWPYVYERGDRTLYSKVIPQNIAHLNLSTTVWIRRGVPEYLYHREKYLTSRRAHVTLFEMNRKLKMWKRLRGELQALKSITCLVRTRFREPRSTIDEDNMPEGWEEALAVERVMRFLTVWKDIDYVNCAIRDAEGGPNKDHHERIDAECKRRLAGKEWSDDAKIDDFQIEDFFSYG